MRQDWRDVSTIYVGFAWPNAHPDLEIATKLADPTKLAKFVLKQVKSNVESPSNLGLILEHITILSEVRILSMYHQLDKKEMDTRYCGLSRLL
jgi:hypothetical protein